MSTALPSPGEILIVKASEKHPDRYQTRVMAIDDGDDTLLDDDMFYGVVLDGWRRGQKWRFKVSHIIPKSNGIFA